MNRESSVYTLDFINEPTEQSLHSVDTPVLRFPVRAARQKKCPCFR